MDIWALILLAVGGLVLTLGDLAMKKWVISNKIYFYIVGLIIYLIGLNFLAQSFKYKNMAVASIIFVIFNVVTLSIFSWIYFNEKLNALEMIGLMLGLASVVILELAKS